MKRQQIKQTQDKSRNKLKRIGICRLVSDPLVEQRDLLENLGRWRDFQSRQIWVHVIYRRSVTEDVQLLASGDSCI
jgi:hypothetical protein